MRTAVVALFAAAICSGSQSVQLNGSVTGVYTVPNTGPYNSLGSYYYDFRIHGWSYPASGCAHNPLFQIIGARGVSFCNPSAYTNLIVVFPPDNVAGGVPVLLDGPHISIVSAAATNPMVLTLASTPFSVTMGVGAPRCVAESRRHGLHGPQLYEPDRYGGLGEQCHDQCGWNRLHLHREFGAVYATDIVVRVHRDLRVMAWIGEVWDVGGQGYASNSNNITTVYTPTLPQTIQIGDSTVATVDLAYLRWYSGTIAMGIAPPQGGAGGDLGDWEFEGNGNDGSGHGLTVTWGTGVSYGVTPVYGPACNAGTPQSFRAGFPAALNDVLSYPLDGGTPLSYFWQQIPSTLSDIHLQRLRWSGQRTATPTVTGAVFGPLNVQLTVTQGNGQYHCTVHHGAVARTAMAR